MVRRGDPQEIIRFTGEATSLMESICEMSKTLNAIIIKCSLEYVFQTFRINNSVRKLSFN